MTRIGCSSWLTRSSSGTDAADNSPREGGERSGQADGQGGQRLQASGALSGLRRSVVSALGGGHRPRVTLPAQTAKDKGKAVASTSSMPSSPRARSSHEASSHGHNGASTSASARPHVTLGELMHHERETVLTQQYMAGMHGAAPRKPTVRWAADIPDVNREDKVNGQSKGQQPPVSMHECTDPEQVAIIEQIGRNKRYENVYGFGSMPIEDDDATGEPFNGPAAAAPSTTGPAAKMLAQAFNWDSDSEHSGSED